MRKFEPQYLIFFAILTLLLIPLPEKSPFIKAIEDTAHIPLFAFTTYLFIHVLNHLHLKKLESPYAIAVIAFFAAVGMGIGTELLQDILSNGREPEKKDVINNTIGSIIMSVYWATAQPGCLWTRNLKILVRITTATFLILPLTPIISEGNIIIQRNKNFPVLCSFEQPFESKFIFGAWGTRLYRKSPPAEWQKNSSSYAGKVVIKPHVNFPGIVLSNLQSNWTSYTALSFEVFVESHIDCSATLWITDKGKRSKFKDRIQQVYNFNQGMNNVRACFSDLSPDSLSPPLDFGAIKEFGFYLNGLKEITVVWVDNFQLRDRTNN